MTNKKSKYTVPQAMEALAAKGVDFPGNFIDIENAQPLGNKSWGKIDFLKKVAKMSVKGWVKYKKRMQS